MKKLVIIALAVLAIVAAGVAINVWLANREPVLATPGPYEIGRQQLHAQLDAAKKREAQFEQQDWNSITLLHGLITAHQQRIDKLASNTQASEILAYDHDSITRLAARIAELEAKQRAEWAKKTADTTPVALRP